jgi:hypothetical protein
MNNLKITIVTVFSFIILATSCGKKNPTPPAPTKDKYDLPLPTQTGANTLGCLIDGVPFVVEGEYNWFTGNGLESSFSITDSVFIIRAKLNNPRTNLMICSKVHNSIIGKHTANKYLISSYSYLSSNGASIPGQNGFFTANDTLPASITITNSDIIMPVTTLKDNFISGTFDLTLTKSDGTLMRITEGRFDYKFK